MSERMRVALGLKARTGRAILVAIGAPDPARVLQRTELKLLPSGDFAPYHAAEGLPSAAAHKRVDRSIAAAHRLAEEGIRRLWFRAIPGSPDIGSSPFGGL